VEETLSIGEVAARSGCQPSALRFYEVQGLVHAARSDGGQRRYDREVLRRIAFIKAAQRVGLSLDEIRDALARLPDGRTPTARDWARVSKAWRARLDAEIAALVALRDDLTSCIGCGCLSLTTCKLYNPSDGAATLGPGARYLLGDSAADVMSSGAGSAAATSVE
jgi:MerR family redox-sensitive transcriptional activator SoxR